jgi:hypothetical protein
MNKYHKDEKHIIKDNVEALKVIMEEKEDILALLNPAPGANSAFHSYQTADHYVMASYHKDHGTKEDDGFLVVMVPKSSWTFQRAAQLFADCIVDNTPGGISYGHKEKQNKQNN